MSTSNSKKGLLAALAIVAAAAAGWYGWQQYTGGQSSGSRGTTVTKAGKSKSGKTSKASADSASPEAMIDEALQLSGLKRQIEQLPQAFQAGAASAPGRDKVPPAVAGQIEKIVLDAFNQEKFLDAIVSRLKENYDPKHMEALISDMSKPEFKRMVDMELNTGTPEQQMAFLQGLSSKPLPAARVTALQNLDRASNASEIGAEVALTMIDSMSSSFIGDNPAERAKFEKIMAQQRAPMLDAMKSGMMAQMAYIYRDASDAEIDAYARTYQTEHAQWFTTHAVGALKDSFRKAARRAGDNMVSFIKKSAPNSQAQSGSAASTTEPAGKPQLPAYTAASSESSNLPARSYSLPQGDLRYCLDLKDNHRIAHCAVTPR